MKEYIEYYYNLVVDTITHRSKTYYFNCDGINYALCECEFLDYNFYQILQTDSFYGEKYKLIVNNKNEIYSVINGKKYILFSIIKKIENRKIMIEDIRMDHYIHNDNGLSENVMRFPWTTLWEQKIDYFENWLDVKLEQYKKYYAMFNYYIGISENALLYLKQSLGKLSFNTNMTIQHNRIYLDDDLCTFFNPLNLVVDHGCRDICEYFKQKLLCNELNIHDVDNILKKGKYSKEWLIFFYSRMLYPTFFYDVFENSIITGDDNGLEKLENMIVLHYNFISDLTLYLNNNYAIPVIQWLKKVDNNCLL